MYNLTPGPVPAASRPSHAALPDPAAVPERVTPPIDPVLLPLPDTADDDLSDGPTVAKALGHTSTSKIAGARRKGKQRAIVDEAGQSKAKRKRSSDDEVDERASKRGRPQGAGNYTGDDLKALLDFIEAELPLSQRGWTVVHAKYSKWARARGRPQRPAKSLETKYKQVCSLLCES